MSDHDRKFFDSFVLILAILVGITLAIYFIAGNIAEKTQRAYVKEEIAAQALVAQRIEPLGRVAVAGEEPVMEPSEPTVVNVAAPAAAEISGEEIYNTVCMICHTAGIAGSPKLGDTEAWAPRIAQGNETLYQHAIQGYQGSAGVMPAKGGRADLADAAVIAAVDYIVEQSK